MDRIFNFVLESTNCNCMGGLSCVALELICYVAVELVVL